MSYYRNGKGAELGAETNSTKGDTKRTHAIGSGHRHR